MGCWGGVGGGSERRLENGVLGDVCVCGGRE